MKTELVQSLWRDILNAGVQQHRLIDEHPLHLYFGVDSDGLAVFFLVSDVEPAPPKINGLVTTQVRRRGDQKWVAVVALTASAYSEAFMGMCLELARRTDGACSEAEGVAHFDATLAHWQKMLSTLSMRTLSREQMRGLFAELSFGKELARHTSLSEMVQAWDGPMGSAQDFRHPALGNFEVKGLGIDGRRVRISSVEQLDPTPAAKVDLVVVQVEDDPLSMSPKAVTLADLVQSIRADLHPNTGVLDEFDNRIAAMGLDTSDPIYAEMRFICVGMRIYRTDSDFPRLRIANVVAGIENVSYDLRLTSLEPFSVSVQVALTPALSADSADGAQL